MLYLHSSVLLYYTIIDFNLVDMRIYLTPKSDSRGTKVEKLLTHAPERYTAGFCMVAKVILWCI